VQQLVLKHEYWISVPQRRLKHPFRVICIGGCHHLQAGNSSKVALHILRMLGSAARRANRRAHDQGHSSGATGHVTHFCGVIDDLIAGQKEKNSVLDVSNWTHSHQSRPSRDSKEPELRNGRIDHPVRESIFKTQGNSEGAAPSSSDSNILTYAEHPWISRHFFRYSLAQRLSDSQAFGLIS